jgi:hypothetical protein
LLKLDSQKGRQALAALKLPAVLNSDGKPENPILMVKTRHPEITYVMKTQSGKNIMTRASSARLRRFQDTHLYGEHRENIPIIPITRFDITTPEVKIDNFCVVE